jgi:hypothetical protein
MRHILEQGTAMAERDELDRLVEEATAALQRLSIIVPMAVNLAYRAGAKETANRLAELALDFPDTGAAASSGASALPVHDAPAKRAKGRVINTIREYLAHAPDRSAPESDLRSSLVVGRGLNRSSVHMALKRLKEIGDVIETDGRLQLVERSPADKEIGAAESLAVAPAAPDHQTNQGVLMEPP